MSVAVAITIGFVKAESGRFWGLRAALLLGDGEADILACTSFPKSHWRRLASDNLVERLNRGIRRRTDVVQVVPDEPSPLRLVGELLIEVNTEWTPGRRYFSLESMHETAPSPTLSTQEVHAGSPY